MKTHCFTLDLRNEPSLIAEYKRYHQPENIWPGVLARIRSGGVVSEEIFLAGNRLVMILQTTDDFSLADKIAADNSDTEMQEWEKLMWKYQQPFPDARPDEKWVLMEKIFEVR